MFSGKWEGLRQGPMVTSAVYPPVLGVILAGSVFIKFFQIVGELQGISFMTMASKRIALFHMSLSFPYSSSL